jgi:hypothetical protein
MTDIEHYRHAWIDVGRGDVEASYPVVPGLPDGRYVHRATMDALRERHRGAVEAGDRYRTALLTIAEYRPGSPESDVAHAALRE